MSVTNKTTRGGEAMEHEQCNLDRLSLFAPVPKNHSEPWTREELIGQLQHIEQVYGEAADIYTIGAHIYSSEDIRNMLWEVVRYGTKELDDSHRAEQAINNFASSKDVLLCDSDAIRSMIEGSLDENWDASMTIATIACSGWKLVSYGDVDCIPIGGETDFLLVRDTSTAVVKQVCNILDEVYETDGISFDQAMTIEPTYFDVQSWRDYILKLMPLQDSQVDTDKRWTDDMPLWQANTVTNDYGNPTLTITNSNQALVIQHLLDGVTASRRALIQQTDRQTSEIRDLRRQIADLKKGTTPKTADTNNRTVSKRRYADNFVHSIVNAAKAAKTAKRPTPPG